MLSRHHYSGSLIRKQAGPGWPIPDFFKRPPEIHQTGLHPQNFCRSTMQIRENNMRAFLLVAAAVLAFAGAMTFELRNANAVVCAAGVVRAGCAGARGALV